MDHNQFHSSIENTTRNTSDYNSINLPQPLPISNHNSSIINSSNDKWKIASSNNRFKKVASPSNKRSHYNYDYSSPISTSSYNQSQQEYALSPNSSSALGRSQSHFSKLERYKSKSPIINAERERYLSPRPDIIAAPPIEDAVDETIDVNAKNNEKNLTIEEELAQKNSKPMPKKDFVPWTWWSGFAFFLTCCIPNWILSTCGRKKTKLVQQAWREKVILLETLNLSLLLI
jgi:hypothetical protein